MSPPAPLIPPPPPPVVTCNERRLNKYKSTIRPNPFRLEQCRWAEENGELQFGCYKARICLQRPPIQCQYRNIPSILQQGPTCGMVAVSMIMNGSPTAEELLEKARHDQLSYNGELFSAQYLYKTLCDALTADQQNVAMTCKMYEGKLDTTDIKEQLQTGACLLVPYDPDYNHEPCLRFGHSAHWALILGYLITETNQFFVLARHGKSKNIAVWSLENLSKSNSNLIEFAQPKNYPHLEFVVPPGGLSGDLGLKERAIIVNELPQDIIKII